ncbi:MAG: hypothetical protein ACI8WB_004286, partial [Phenylobacterium sp.]
MVLPRHNLALAPQNHNLLLLPQHRKITGTTPNKRPIVTALNQCQ